MRLPIRRMAPRANAERDSSEANVRAGPHQPASYNRLTCRSHRVPAFHIRAMRFAPFGAEPERAARRRAAFTEGTRAVAPAAFATGIWGLVTGVAMVKAGLTPWQALGMTLLVYAGSAQLAALPLIAASAPISVVLLTAAVVNLRFLIFSAALQPYFRRHSLLRRAALGYIATDVGFAVFMARFGDASDKERGTSEQLWIFLGMATRIWIAWQSFSLAGILLAAQVPTEWGLEFAAIIGLIALAVPMITTRPTLIGAIVSGAVAVAAANLPLKLGLVLAVVIGIVASMVAETVLRKRRSA
jgi:branched chain amino acid efflux pump